jgi:hypothetical protein
LQIIVKCPRLVNDLLCFRNCEIFRVKLEIGKSNFTLGIQYADACNIIVQNTTPFRRGSTVGIVTAYGLDD